MKVQETVGVSDQTKLADAEARLRVSALIDDELDDASIETTIDALLATEGLAHFWLNAHRAGDWLRCDEVVAVGDDQLALRRFAKELASEPAIVAPKSTKSSRSTHFWLRTGLPGASIAAALVVVAWVATPFGRSDDSKKTLASSSDVSTVLIAKVNTSAEAEAGTGELKTIDPDRLSPYLAAHRDVTPFAFRGPSARPAAFNAPPSSAGLSSLPTPQ